MRSNLRIVASAVGLLTAFAAQAQTIAELANATAEYQVLVAKQKRAEAIAEAQQPAPPVTIATGAPQQSPAPLTTPVTPAPPTVPDVGNISPPPGVPGLPLPAQGVR